MDGYRAPPLAFGDDRALMEKVLYVYNIIYYSNYQILFKLPKLFTDFN